MSTVEIILISVAMVSLIVSIITLARAHSWEIMVERKHSAIDASEVRVRHLIDDLDTALFNVKSDLLDLKTTFYKSGIETLKVKSDDNEKSIESIRKDLLDLQVISGTLPSRAGTMRQEIENTLEALKSVQSSYLETRAITERTKEQVEKLAEAYASLHFTGREIEEMRDELEDLSRKSS